MSHYFNPKYRWYDCVAVFGAVMLFFTLMSDAEGFWALLSIGVSILCMLQPVLHAGKD